MAKYLSFLMLILFLSACENVENTSDQFQKKDGLLFFKNKVVATWEHQELPRCQACNLTTYSKASPAGPTKFKRIDNTDQELILLTIERARFSFALSMAEQQHSFRLKAREKKLYIALNQEDFFPLKNNVPIQLKINDKNYYLNLNALRFYHEKIANKATEKTSYEADLTLWLKQP